jgi:hypothetical protein
MAFAYMYVWKMCNHLQALLQKKKPLNLRDVREGGKGDAMQIRTYVSCERAIARSRACRTRALETAFTSSPKPIIAGEGIRTHRRETSFFLTVPEFPSWHNDLSHQIQFQKQRFQMPKSDI